MVMIVRWQSDLVDTKQSVLPVCDKTYHMNKGILQKGDEIENLPNKALSKYLITSLMVWDVMVCWPLVNTSSSRSTITVPSSSASSTNFCTLYTQRWITFTLCKVLLVNIKYYWFCELVSIQAKYENIKRFSTTIFNFFKATILYIQTVSFMYLLLKTAVSQ